MRGVVNTLFLCGAMMALSSCFSCPYRKRRDAGGEKYADSLPALHVMGIVNPIMAIVDSTGGISDFRYEADRLKEGSCGRYGKFEVHSNPLAFEVRSGGEGYDARYENIRLDDCGRVLSMEQTVKNFIPTGNSVYGSACHVAYSMSYQDGYIKQISYSLEDEDGQNELGKIVYTWYDGDIRTVVIDFCSRYHAYEEHILQKFIYAHDDSLRTVAGLYAYDLVNPPYIHEFVWYTGILGKAMKRLPEQVLVERCGDCGDRAVRFGLNDGDVMMSRQQSYEDGAVLKFAYGICP